MSGASFPAPLHFPTQGPSYPDSPHLVTSISGLANGRLCADSADRLPSTLTLNLLLPLHSSFHLTCISPAFPNPLPSRPSEPTAAPPPELWEEECGGEGGWISGRPGATCWLAPSFCCAAVSGHLCTLGLHAGKGTFSALQSPVNHRTTPIKPHRHISARAGGDRLGEGCQGLVEASMVGNLLRTGGARGAGALGWAVGVLRDQGPVGALPSSSLATCCNGHSPLAPGRPW